MLLDRLAVPFAQKGSGVDESYLAGEAPRDRALRLATAKARAIARQHPEATVIGSDQVAAAGTLILDKPGSPERACEQLAALSGTVARFYTACAILGPADFNAAHVDETSVTFRQLSGDEIERYVARERPFDCAGGFKAEGLGIALFERIESVDPTALIGLPLIWVAATLRRLGHAVP